MADPLPELATPNSSGKLASSPPNPQHGSATNCSRPSSSPLVHRQATVPPPEAFAQRHRDETAQNDVMDARLGQPFGRAGEPHEVRMYRGAQRSSAIRGTPGEAYKVSMYHGMQPPSPLRGGSLDVLCQIDRESPGDIYSPGISDTPESPTGRTLWLRSKPLSQFGQRLQPEQSPFDSDNRKREVPLGHENECLGLALSPALVAPTYRMQLEYKTKTKFQQSPGSSTASSTLEDSFTRKDNVHRYEPRIHTALGGERNDTKDAPRALASPRQGFWNRLGLSGHTLRLSPLKSHNASPGPMKLNLTPLRAVPPKAVQVLGPQSLGILHRNPLTIDDTAEPGYKYLFSHTRAAPSPSETVRQAASVPSRQSYYIQRPRSYFTAESSKQGRDGFQSGNGSASVTPELRPDDEDEHPPTPPSKSSLHKRYAMPGKKTPESQSPSKDPRYDDADRMKLFKTHENEDHGQPKLEGAGDVRHQDIVQSTTTQETGFRSLQSNSSDRRHSTGIGTPSGPSAPASESSMRLSSVEERERRSLFYRIPEGSVLLPTVYTDPSHQSVAQHNQPSSRGNISVSLNRLRQDPLFVPPQMRQEPSSSASGSGSKSRDASNSTSGSIPVYLDTPPTGKPEPAKLAEMAAEFSSTRSGHRTTNGAAKEMKLQLPKPEYPADTNTSKEASNSRKRRTATSSPKLTKPQTPIRLPLLTMSSVRPSYETMTATDLDTNAATCNATTLEPDKKYATWPIYNDVGEEKGSRPQESQEKASVQKQHDFAGAIGDAWHNQQKLAAAVNDILKNQAANSVAVARIEDALKDISARITQLNEDVQVIVRCITTANPGGEARPSYAADFRYSAGLATMDNYRGGGGGDQVPREPGGATSNIRREDGGVTSAGPAGKWDTSPSKSFMSMPAALSEWKKKLTPTKTGS